MRFRKRVPKSISYVKLFNIATLKITYISQSTSKTSKNDLQRITNKMNLSNLGSLFSKRWLFCNYSNASNKCTNKILFVLIYMFPQRHRWSICLELMDLLKIISWVRIICLSRGGPLMLKSTWNFILDQRSRYKPNWPRLWPQFSQISHQ